MWLCLVSALCSTREKADRRYLFRAPGEAKEDRLWGLTEELLQDYDVFVKSCSVAATSVPSGKKFGKIKGTEITALFSCISEHGQ